MTGGPLGYRIIDDQPVIYSVGWDGIDDGGRPAVGDGEPDSNAAWLDMTRPSGDWILWGFETAAELVK